MRDEQINEIKNVESEAAVVATLIHHPEFYFLSENLKYEYFTDTMQGIMYYAISKLAQQNAEMITPMTVIAVLNNNVSTMSWANKLTDQFLEDTFGFADSCAVSTPEEYLVFVKNVVSTSFRRNTYAKLKSCESLCLNSSDENIEQKIYATLDKAMLEYSVNDTIPLYSDIVRDTWNDIRMRQLTPKLRAIPFKFPTLNEYVTLERGELVILGALMKMGKSMWLLNCAYDLLKRGLHVMYIDSELSTRLFTCRLISHITGIEYRKIRSGEYDKEDEAKIEEALKFLESSSFIHQYVPVFDDNNLYTAVKKAHHKIGLDVVIIDYFKSGGDGDAFATYQAMGNTIDTFKNRLCGEMNIMGLGAAQATPSGRLADSIKIARNASTILMLSEKTPEEIERDGVECGNRKLVVALNRNGPQQAEGEYIDLNFDGNRILFEEAKQHKNNCPY